MHDYAADKNEIKLEKTDNKESKKAGVRNTVTGRNQRFLCSSRKK